MNVKWTNIVFVLRYGDETLHLWKPLLNTNDQRGFIAMFNATKHNIRPFHIHVFVNMSDCNILFITEIIKFNLKIRNTTYRAAVHK